MSVYESGNSASSPPRSSTLPPSSIEPSRAHPTIGTARESCLNKPSPANSDAHAFPNRNRIAPLSPRSRAQRYPGSRTPKDFPNTNGVASPFHRPTAATQLGVMPSSRAIEHRPTLPHPRQTSPPVCHTIVTRLAPSRNTPDP